MAVAVERLGCHGWLSRKQRICLGRQKPSALRIHHDPDLDLDLDHDLDYDCGDNSVL